MTDWLTTWGSLVLTGVLVGVTGWYAYLTKSLAQSSSKAAESARVAAEASQLSVAATLAGLRVSFEVEPWLTPDLDKPIGDDEVERQMGVAFVFSGVVVLAQGATLFVHWCMLEACVFQLSTGNLDTLRRTQLQPSAGQVVKMHRGESETFAFPDEYAVPSGKVCSLKVRIQYSLTEHGPIESVVVEWDDMDESRHRPDRRSSAREHD